MGHVEQMTGATLTVAAGQPAWRWRVHTVGTRSGSPADSARQTAGTTGCPQAGKAPRWRSGSELSDEGGVGRGGGGAGGGHGGGSGGGSGTSSSCSGGAGAGGGEAGSGGQEAAADRSRLTCTFVPPRCFSHGSQGLDTPFPPSTAEVQITRPAYSLLLLLLLLGRLLVIYWFPFSPIRQIKSASTTQQTLRPPCSPVWQGFGGFLLLNWSAHRHSLINL